MGLGRKNLVYSLILAGIMMLFLVGYFVYMLPALYVDAVMEQNLKSVREQHSSYVRNGTYEGVAVKNSAACFSLEIPFDGDKVLVTGKSFSAEIVVKDTRLYEILSRCRETLKASSMEESHSMEYSAYLGEEIGELSAVFKEVMEENLSLPLEVKLVHQWDEDEFSHESFRIHLYSDNVCVLEAGVEDSANRYTNYIAMEQRADSVIFTYLPVVAPDMNEIRPVVLRSLPMLGAVILLVVLLFSQVYSKGIVAPIVALVRRTVEMKHAVSGKGCSAEGKEERDEIRELAVTLEDFYLQIRESMRMLEETNRQLAEENQRQEIFLRASSHQLKTPIAAALLLVEGMINEIGRYRESKVYLPKVKEQLLSMRKIVEDILYLNHCTENMHPQQIDLQEFVQDKLQTYQIPVVEKGISVEFMGESGLSVCTDEMVFSQILDNLLSNGVKYTPAGGHVQISIRRTGQEEGIIIPEEGRNSGEKGRGEIRIENSGAAISEELLPHIFEPFVSGANSACDMGTCGHGLGLYIASYYAGKLGFDLTVQNGGIGVIAVLTVAIL